MIFVITVTTRVAVLLFVGLAMFGAGLPSASANTIEHRFTIERLPLTAALLKFAQQADVSLVLPVLSFRDGKSSPVSGNLTSVDALKKLLQRSSYAFEVLDSGAIKIFLKPPEAPKPIIVTTVERPSSPRIEEILVSSTRRLDRLQQLPYSISVITGTDLDDNAVSTTGGAARFLSSVSATNLGRGRKIYYKQRSNYPIMSIIVIVDCVGKV